MRSVTVQPQGLPRKVLRKAAELGVHNDCMAAGIGRCCDDCFKITLRAMDYFYADVPREWVEFTVMSDIANDRHDDRHAN
jgi:hypothetical protein